jgi:hypothetical protein
MNVRNVALCAIVEADLGDFRTGANDFAAQLGIGDVKDFALTGGNRNDIRLHDVNSLLPGALTPV